MAKFQIQETVINGQDEAVTVRLGAGTGSSNYVTSKEVGKPVKLVGESRFDLCAAGDPIEAVIVAVENAAQDDYTLGSIVDEGYKQVTFDGLQATAGTGTVALGDYVVAGTAVAKGTALTGPMKVCKATNQPGAAVVSTIPATNSAADIKTAIDAALVLQASANKNSVHAWRVVSLGTAGTGAVGTTGIVQRVTC